MSSKLFIVVYLARLTSRNFSELFSVFLSRGCLPCKTILANNYGMLLSVCVKRLLDLMTTVIDSSDLYVNC